MNAVEKNASRHMLCERHACEPRGVACVNVLFVSLSVEETAKFRSRDCAR